MSSRLSRGVNGLILFPDSLEVFFVGLRNYSKSSMSSAGKRKIRVMMGDLVLTSGPSVARVRNTINFLVAYASGVVVS